jgi:hypothetical protein
MPPRTKLDVHQPDNASNDTSDNINEGIEEEVTNGEEG